MKQHLRKEKNCLNCGSEITDRFCSHCGQENIEPKETVGYLVAHFLGDITHYDSKFFKTIRLLLFKPGFLTRQYLAGRRTAYLNPIRMYVFISAVFFLFLLLLKDDVESGNETDESTRIENLYKHRLADSLRQHSQWPANPTGYDSGRIQTLVRLTSSLDSVQHKSANDEEIGFHLGEKGVTFILKEDKFNSVREYDSVQRVSPDSSKNKGFLNWMIRTNIKLKEKYGSRRQVIVSENFQHSIPKVMFVLLPVFALFIYLLHSKKKYYYAQHLIYSIHFHTFLFFLLLTTSLLKFIPGGRAWDFFIAFITLVIPFIYLLISLRNVYQQSFGWALLKSFIILILYLILLVIGLVSLAMFSFMTA